MLVNAGVIPVFFIIDVFYSCWHLIKLIYKFYDNYKMNKFINKYYILILFSLSDYLHGTEEGEDDTARLCNICLDEIKVGKKLLCGHVFHLRCIKYNSFI